MGDFLAVDYPDNPFIIFGPPHLAALAIIGLIVFLLARYGSKMSARQRMWFRYGVGTLLVLNEGAWHLWHLATGRWTVQTMLPLHLCSLLVFSTAYMLLTRNKTIFEFSYFMGIGAAIQALLTPDLGIYGYPHFRFFQTFISHGLIFVSPFFMVFVEGFRPQWRSLLRVFAILNVYMVPVLILNLLIGSNYLFIAHRPETPSLIDFLGPWPWYILSLEAIGVLTCVILYLPWAWKDWREKAVSAAAAG